MVINIISYWKGNKLKFKKLKLKKKTNVRKYKSKSLTMEQIGERDTDLICSLWNSQTSPKKVYIGRYRLHHGFVGFWLRVYGILEKNDYIKGVGKSFMKDDIKDKPDWFNFKK